MMRLFITQKRQGAYHEGMSGVYRDRKRIRGNFFEGLHVNADGSIKKGFRKGREIALESTVVLRTATRNNSAQKREAKILEL